MVQLRRLVIGSPEITGGYRIAEDRPFHAGGKAVLAGLGMDAGGLGDSLMIADKYWADSGGWGENASPGGWGRSGP
jgi:hypothetical protein